MCAGSQASRQTRRPRARVAGCGLCKAAPTGSRRFYGVEFRPEQVRRDETIVWKTTKLFYGGKRRKIRYKEVNEVYWQGGARRTPLRLLVVAPTPYSKRLSSKMYYRQPAYLLTTDLASQARELLQIYFAVGRSR